MEKTGIYQVLSQSPLFKKIPPLKIEELLKQVPHRFVKHPKSKIIAFRGERCEYLLTLVKGAVRCEMIDLKGKSVEVETITAPRPLAPAFVFGSKNIYPVDVTTEQETLVLSLPKSSLIRLIQLNTEVLRNYLDLLSNRTHFLSERLWFMSFKTIKEKFCNYLLSLVKPGENRVILPKNQQELSEFFGVSRPSLARVIGDLEKEEIIKHNRREVIINNMEQLKQYLD